MGRDTTIGILDEADTFTNRLAWILFSSEQDARLFAPDRGQNVKGEFDWRPGIPLHRYPSMTGALEETMSESYVSGGQCVRPMYEVFIDGENYRTMRCEPCETWWKGSDPCFVCGEKRGGDITTVITARNSHHRLPQMQPLRNGDRFRIPVVEQPRTVYMSEDADPSSVVEYARRDIEVTFMIFDERDFGRVRFLMEANTSPRQTVSMRIDRDDLAWMDDADMLRLQRDMIDRLNIRSQRSREEEERSAYYQFMRREASIRARERIGPSRIQGERVNQQIVDEAFSFDIETTGFNSELWAGLYDHRIINFQGDSNLPRELSHYEPPFIPAEDNMENETVRERALRLNRERRAWADMNRPVTEQRRRREV